MVVLANYDDIPFKEPVGLMARQEQLEGIRGDPDRVAFGDLSRVMKFRVIRICHFT